MKGIKNENLTRNNPALIPVRRRFRRPVLPDPEFCRSGDAVGIWENGREAGMSRDEIKRRLAPYSGKQVQEAIEEMKRRHHASEMDEMPRR
jgi:hypothetical protein